MWDRHYERYWNHITDFEGYILNNQIENVGQEDTLIPIFSSKYSPNFIFSVLLWRVDLWKSLSLKQWNKIIQSIDRRGAENKVFLIHDYGKYCDLIFLYRYLGIDSIKLLFDDTVINKDEKKKVLTDIEKIDFLFLKRESDIEDFKDGTFPDNGLYELVQERLIVEGAVKSRKNIEGMRKDILTYIKKIDSSSQG